MFPGLRDAVDELEVPADGRALTEVLGLLDRLAAKVARAVGEFDRAALWDLDGATSMVAWLRDAGLSSRSAGRLVKDAKRLRVLPVLAGAWEAGELSGGQIETVVGNVPDRHVGRFAEHEAAVVPTLVGLSVADTARVMNEWSARADALDETPVPVERPGDFFLSQTFEGRWRADGTFDTEGGAILSKALELADSRDFDVPVPQRRAEALVAVAAFFLDNQHKQLGGRHRPHVNVIVEASELHDNPRAELVDEQLLLDPATTDRLLCDCVVHRVLVQRGERGRTAILDIAAATRTIPAAMWTALVIRDRHCRFPGCDNRPTWCEGHHVQWVSRNGKTRMDNLVLLCRRHHRLLHNRPGYMAKLEPDGTLHVTYPDATQRTTRPPSRPCLQ